MNRIPRLLAPGAVLAALLGAPAPGRPAAPPTASFSRSAAAT